MRRYAFPPCMDPLLSRSRFLSLPLPAERRNRHREAMHASSKPQFSKAVRSEKRSSCASLPLTFFLASFSRILYIFPGFLSRPVKKYSPRLKTVCCDFFSLVSIHVSVFINPFIVNNSLKKVFFFVLNYLPCATHLV